MRTRQQRATRASLAAAVVLLGVVAVVHSACAAVAVHQRGYDGAGVWFVLLWLREAPAAAFAWAVLTGAAACVFGGWAAMRDAIEGARPEPFAAAVDPDPEAAVYPPREPGGPARTHAQLWADILAETDRDFARIVVDPPPPPSPPLSPPLGMPYAQPLFAGGCAVSRTLAFNRRDRATDAPTLLDSLADLHRLNRLHRKTHAESDDTPRGTLPTPSARGGAAAGDRRV